MANKTEHGLPVYKKWWFWVIIAIVFIGIFGASASKKQEGGSDSVQGSNIEIGDYIGKDAKEVYESLTNNGYEVKFVFARPNNGGFSEDGFQQYVIECFESESYAEMPFIVTDDSRNGKKITLTIEYSLTVESNKAQEARDAALEAKLGIVESMTACQQYGKANYSGFNMHSVAGKIAEYAKDDNTWFLKYKVDANGYENLTMECSVTGTTASPVVESFVVY